MTKLEVIDSYPPFDRELLSSKVEAHIAPPSSTEPNENFKNKFEGKINDKDTLNGKNPEYFSEAETRRFYIDQQLREAGWEVLDVENNAVHGKVGIEIRVEGMPNTREEGFCDYVLYGRDGSPLAVVEAEKTLVTSRSTKTLQVDIIKKQQPLHHHHP